MGIQIKNLVSHFFDVGCIGHILGGKFQFIPNYKVGPGLLYVFRDNVINLFSRVEEKAAIIAYQDFVNVTGAPYGRTKYAALPIHRLFDDPNSGMGQI